MEESDRLNARLKALLEQVAADIARVDLKPLGSKVPKPVQYFPPPPVQPPPAPVQKEKASPSAEFPRPPAKLASSAPERSKPVGVPKRTRPLPRPSPVVRPAAVIKSHPFPRRRFLGSAFIAAAAGAFLLFRGPGETIFSLPAGQARSGLAISDGRLFSFDPVKQDLLSLSLSGGEARTTVQGRFANASRGGLAWGDNSFWSTDPVRGLIYRHNEEAGHAVSRAYFHQGHPASLDLQGSSLWTADAAAGRIDRFLISRVLTGITLTPVRSYALPAGVRPVGICAPNEDEIWVLDSTRRSLLRFGVRLKALEPLGSFDATAVLSSSGLPVAMAADADAVWIMTEGPDQLVRIPRKRLTWALQR